MDGVDYVDFIAPGVAASTVMFGAIIETTYNSFIRIHVRRVFEAVITTPLSLADVVVGEYLWAATRAVLYGVVFLVVMACFGLVHTPMALLLPPRLPIGALTFAVLGMAYTASSRTSSTSTSSSPGSSRRCSCSPACSSPSPPARAGRRSSAGVLPALAPGRRHPRPHPRRGRRLTLPHVAFLVALLAAAFPFPGARLRRTLLR